MKQHAHTPPRRPDALRWAIFLAILGSAPALAAGPLQATPGPGGTPLINDAHGVPVIDIVAPTANGLSHNQFLDYNVGASGLVLNNALEAGASQLAGALAANPQFQGQAALTILNEVVSRNASLIEGRQEIFGRPADYVLANPNGITVNGGQFINTTRAGFLVGTPILEDGRIRYLDTLGAEGNLLVLKEGAANRDGALALIAPRIEVLGSLETKGDLDVIAGRNRVDRLDGSIAPHASGPSTELDATLFGAMRAGRVRVVSTTEGAGVRMVGTDVQAQDGISMRSAGGLQIEGGQDKQGQLLTERGDLTLASTRNLYMRDVKARAERIDVTAGGTLTLDAKRRQHIERQRESWKNKAWFVTYETYDSDKTLTRRTHEGTELLARSDMRLTSGGDLDLRSARVEAGGDLSVDSAGKLRLGPTLDSQHVAQRIQHRKHLWRGDTDTDRYQESGNPTVLAGQRVSLTAQDTLTVTGSQVTSRGDMSLTARQITVDGQKVRQSGTEHAYRGDLVSGAFFGGRGNEDAQGERTLGSTVQADGTLEVTADQVRIQGSRVRSEGDAVLYSRNGALSVEAAVDRQRQQRDQKNSQVFGLLGSRTQSREERQDVLVSDVSSDTNLRLASDAELQVRGARLTAGQRLELQAKGDLDIVPERQTRERHADEQHRTFTASAGQTRAPQGDTPGSKQYAANVGYEVDDTTTRMRTTAHVGSALKGAEIVLDSVRNVRLDTATLTTDSGDVTVKGQKVTLAASHDEHGSETTTTRTGGGLTVGGGIDRVNSAFEGHRRQQVDQVRDTTVARTTITSAGDLTIETPHLIDQAAQLSAGKQARTVAKTLDNQAVSDTHERTQRQNDWQGTLGASLEYRDLTRPIERLVTGEEAARFQQAGPEDAMAPPNLGADVTAGHLRRETHEQSTQAQVAQYTGGTVTVEADTLLDEGTVYKAEGGRLDLAVQDHQARAAQDTTRRQVSELAVDGDGRVDSSTGEDINLRLAGKGGSLTQDTERRTARPATFQGHQGVQIQLGSDGRYEASGFEGGQGDVTVRSDGTLTVVQADDTQAERIDQLNGNAWAKGGNRPTNVGVEARGYLDRVERQRTDTQARVAQAQADGDVRFTSAGDLHLEGLRIGTRERPVASAELNSGGVASLVAGADTHQAHGSTLGGGGELGYKQGTSRGGSLGGHLTSGRVEERETNAVMAEVHTRGKATVASQARDDQAVHLRGVRMTAGEIAFQASNGGLRVEAGDSREHRDNLDVTGGAGLALNKAGAPDADSRGLHGRVQIGLDKRDNQVHVDSQLRADRLTLLSQGDTRLEGVQVQTGQISGEVGGDLHVASLKDSVNTLSVKADARLSHEKNPQGYTNAVAAVTGPASEKVLDKVGPALSKIEPSISPTLKVDISHQQRETVAQQTVLNGQNGIDLNVGGDTSLVGARLQSVNGAVDLRTASLSKETLSGYDYRRDVGLDASNAPVDLGTAIAQASQGAGAADGENALDLGLLRTRGHSTSAQWTSTVQGKQDR
ncbi:filamentous hemagglutinin N-terminal domain-containing protein [Pseudomonas entomophila]|uniref:hemagglutinin repeat-containing protein n=1 Tax=Pseudomonas entomophila TaxID=312306 RepID=UPI0015E3C7A6|nr:hemagglutinin repeat-containing protein [Pseudomonas entomophila]MBA1189940.1 filamentous hemagglutinin N-terminal domain-containing protein [Pseudomonas entomophila]